MIRAFVAPCCRSGIILARANELGTLVVGAPSQVSPSRPESVSGPLSSAQYCSRVVSAREGVRLLAHTWGGGVSLGLFVIKVFYGLLRGIL